MEIIFVGICIYDSVFRISQKSHLFTFNEKEISTFRPPLHYIFITITNLSNQLCTIISSSGFNRYPWLINYIILCLNIRCSQLVPQMTLLLVHLGQQMPARRQSHCVHNHTASLSSSLCHLPASWPVEDRTEFKLKAIEAKTLCIRVLAVEPL